MNIRNKTYGIKFPFGDSVNGDFLSLTGRPEDEIKANLIHLLLTRKGSRYFLPEFGTNLYQYLFEPITEELIAKIEDEIIDACEKFLPNLKIDKVNIDSFFGDFDYNKQRSLLVRIDYTITSRTFSVSDTITIQL